MSDDSVTITSDNGRFSNSVVSESDLPSFSNAIDVQYTSDFRSWGTCTPTFCHLNPVCYNVRYNTRPSLGAVDGGSDERFEGNDCRQLGRRHPP
jgi:hypothetical protein